MPARSQLARFLQGLLVLQLGAALAWWLLWRGTAPNLAVGGALALVLIAPIVLGVEFFVLGLVSRLPGEPTPSAGALFRAWIGETLDFFRVFCQRMPLAWRAEPDHLPAASRGRTGVVLVHGFMCNRGVWTPWLRTLRQRELAFVAVNLEPVFTPIDRYAATVEEAVRRVTEATGQPPVLVCHSMGGLAARAWLRSHADNARRVRHVVTIGSPHHGTWLAQFSHLPNGRQMRQGSDWLHQLEADEALRPRPPFTCWYSDCDNVVFPVTTATLPGADNRLLPGPAHVELAFHPHVVAETLRLLETPQPAS